MISEGSIHLALISYSSESRLVTQASPFGVKRCEVHVLSATTNETHFKSKSVILGSRLKKRAVLRYKLMILINTMCQQKQ